MFKQIKPAEIPDNFIDIIGREAFLITAGDQSGYNMMTAGWGYAGTMWGSDSVAVVIRPQRYTMEFVEKSDYFTLSFYGDNKDIHKICGTKSGRDCDKTALCGLTPVFEDGTVYFNEARMVIICKKQYMQKMDPDCFTDLQARDRWYPQKDYHNVIIGKIEKVLVK